MTFAMFLKFIGIELAIAMSLYPACFVRAIIKMDGMLRGA